MLRLGFGARREGWAAGQAGPSELGRGESRPGERVGLGQRAGLAWGKKRFGLGLGFWVAMGLGFCFGFSISISIFLFLVLFQTKLFEFKQNLNSTPMHSNKIKPCTSMNATKI